VRYMNYLTSGLKKVRNALQMSAGNKTLEAENEDNQPSIKISHKNADPKDTELDPMLAESPDLPEQAVEQTATEAAAPSTHEDPANTNNARSAEAVSDVNAKAGLPNAETNQETNSSTTEPASAAVAKVVVTAEAPADTTDEAALTLTGNLLDLTWSHDGPDLITDSLCASTKVTVDELNTVAHGGEFGRDGGDDSMDDSDDDPSYVPPADEDRITGKNAKKKRSPSKTKSASACEKKTKKRSKYAPAMLVVGDRRHFLAQRYSANMKGGELVGNQSVRDNAVHFNLAVIRSSPGRITFYPRGLAKKGNSVCTFSRTRDDPHYWQLTDEVDTVLERWQKLVPDPAVSGAAGVELICM